MLDDAWLKFRDKMNKKEHKGMKVLIQSVREDNKFNWVKDSSTCQYINNKVGEIIIIDYDNLALRISIPRAGSFWFKLEELQLPL